MVTNIFLFLLLHLEMERKRKKNDEQEKHMFLVKFNDEIIFVGHIEFTDVMIA